MTDVGYAYREASNHGGMRFRLYEFRLGDVVYRYNSSERQITLDGFPYEPIPINSGSINQTSDPSSDTLKITMPDDLPPASLFRGSGPSQTIIATVRAMHYSTQEAPVMFVGEVTDRRKSQIGQAEITCMYLTAALERTGLRLSYTRSCPHALYDVNCTVDKSLYAVAAIVTSMSGNHIRSSVFDTFEDDWFSGGFFEWSPLPGLVERRSIERHLGNDFLIYGLADGIEVGTLVTAYPGCFRTIDVCLNKFNNVPNYGGFTALPGKNPFSGQPIF
jgi:uncharacterized phage protein (TIGR02218 family)